MKKIYLLLISLFLLFFTGCDAILDAAYPEVAPEEEFLNDKTDYSFEVDGLPFDLYADDYNYVYGEYYPIVRPNDPENIIMKVEFKIQDDRDYNAGYGYFGYEYVDTYVWGMFDNIPYWSNKSVYFQTPYWSDYVDYFHINLGELDFLIDDPWWYGGDMKIKVKVIFDNGFESIQSYDVNIYH